MRSAEKTITPLATATTIVCALSAAGVSLLFQPATELLQAQVEPAKRISGESPVRIPDVMKVYADLGYKAVSGLEKLRKPVSLSQEEASNPNPPPTVVPKDYNEWQKSLMEHLGDQKAKTSQQKDLAGTEYVNSLKGAVGDQDFQNLVTFYLADPNYCYYAYALFLGIAMFFSSIAILAIGKYEAEEITVIPVKK